MGLERSKVASKAQATLGWMVKGLESGREVRSRQGSRDLETYETRNVKITRQTYHKRYPWLRRGLVGKEGGGERGLSTTLKRPSTRELGEVKGIRQGRFHKSRNWGQPNNYKYRIAPYK